MANFWSIVNKVIHDADVLLLVLDARMIEDTRNAEIEKRVKTEGKPLIYVITKADLVENQDNSNNSKKRELGEPRYNPLVQYKKILHPCVFVSSVKHHGTTMLRDRIMIEAKKNKVTNSPIQVGVLGYPNVGKSSLINAMSGGSGAPTSMMSGYTKSMQKIRGDKYIMFLDTPGVIPHMEKESEKHHLIGSVDFTKIKEPDLAVMKIMEQYPGRLEAYYGVKVIDDFEESIENIAIKKHIIMSGKKPNIDKTCRRILKDWQTGVISEL